MHMKASVLFAATAIVSSHAAPSLSSRQATNNTSASGPIVDLGAGGKWLGSVSSDGKVNTWKAIPYAAPPIGNLRYKAPRALAAQNSSVQDVSRDFDGQQTACVQFGTTAFVGVNAGPGVEDCLKLWIWAPAGAKEGDNLPVQVYSHGGGMQNSQSPNNPFDDWVGQNQKFIAVNANYRLGQLGFFNHIGAIQEGEPANVGLLDSRFAMQWVQKYISKFGGDGNAITIAGQSGGGGNIMTQLVLYNGTNPPFSKAMPRSIQQFNTFTVDYVKTRNDAFARALNCTSDSSTAAGAASQLSCMRNVSAEAIRLAALNFSSTRDARGYAWPGWLPSIDGITLFDTPSTLYRQGKIAKVPVMPVAVTNEFARFTPATLPAFNASVNSTLGALANTSLYNSMLAMYPAPIVNGSYDTGTYSDDLHRLWSFNDDSLAKCAAPMVARAYSAAGLPTFQARFNAPQPGYPAYMGTTHSSDNFYLQNATSTFNNQTMVNLALEWRAYVASFIRKGDPNAEKLNTSRTWQQASISDLYEPRMVLSMALNNAAQTQLTNSAMELTDAAEFNRCSYWLSAAVVAQTRQ